MDQQLLSKDWYVAYTFPRAEKKVCSTLEKMGVSSFLPMCNVLRKWSDRIKKISVPLFPNYVFVNINPVERHQVLKVDGLLRYVSFGGKPSTVSEKQIDSLKKMLAGEVEVSNEIYDRVGTPVIITSGPFAGIEGLFIRKNKKNRLVVQIAVLQKSVSVDIPSSSVMKLIR
jgi:transcription antitermination factor NusG